MQARRVGCGIWTKERCAMTSVGKVGVLLAVIGMAAQLGEAGPWAGWVLVAGLVALGVDVVRGVKAFLSSDGR